MDWYKNYENFINLCESPPSLENFLAELREVKDAETIMELLRFCELAFLFGQELNKQSRQTLLHFLCESLQFPNLKRDEFMAVLISSSFAAKAASILRKMPDHPQYPPRLRIWLQNLK